MRGLKLEYRKKRGEIKKRLAEFSRAGKAGDKDIFSELCFCILTPQSRAVYCSRAVEGLKKKGLLFDGCQRAISKNLKGTVRFHNNKARYIVAARNLFKSKDGIRIKEKLKGKCLIELREWLVKNIKGLGYKEASHFLRNIGMGRGIAIIDRHILKNLKKYGVITKIPPSISTRHYLAVEERMREFSEHVGIPLEELDLLFWSAETGFIFK